MSKKTINENYLDRIPLRKSNLEWKTEEDGKVTLLIKNNRFFDKIAQKLFKKPKITYIHLDETGSFVWPLLDEKLDITAIGKLVDEKFGEKASPLYERLAKYFQILESYGFTEWKE